MQDRRGLMYFGVSTGAVLEFDGVTWRKIFLASSVVRSLAMDGSGTIWLGANGNLGYLAPDAAGLLHYSSILDKVPVEERTFTDVWQTLNTPQGVFFRSFERLFRWDGTRMQVWRAAKGSRFQALSAVRGHIYTDQEGIGLEEIVGDELRPAPGGDAYKNALKLFLHPYDETRILVSSRDQLLTLYDGKTVTPFVTQADEYLKKNKLYTTTPLKNGGFCITTLSGGAIVIEHDGKLRQIIDVAAGLPSSDILTAFVDREGSLWLGHDEGVARVALDSPISILSRAAYLDVIEFQGSIYASTGGGGAAVSRLVIDPDTRHSRLIPLRGATQAWTLIDFKDPADPNSEQLLAATSEGVMRVVGDSLVPAMPALRGLNEQTYTISHSQKTPSRVFIGHSDGVGSMRWDGKKWIDEGRLPNAVYEARNIVEDADGVIWISGGSTSLLRVEVTPTGFRDSKVRVISQKEGLVEGTNDVEFVAGEIFVTIDRSKDILRWNAASQQLVTDNRFLLKIDAPDSTPFLSPGYNDDVWSQTVSSEIRRIALFHKNPYGKWTADEDTFRQLSRFRLFQLHSYPDGVIWAAGENLLRFAPKTDTASSKSFPNLIRQVNVGSTVVFGGTSIPANRSFVFRLEVTHFVFNSRR